MNLSRHRVLAEQGLVSQRDLELAVLAEARSRTARDGARAPRDGARGAIDVAEAELDQARRRRWRRSRAPSPRCSRRRATPAARASLRGCEPALSSVDAAGARASRWGDLRLVAKEGAEQVSAGDTLAGARPRHQGPCGGALGRWQRRGVDGGGPSVRLQFEGWPAVQLRLAHGGGRHVRWRRLVHRLDRRWARQLPGRGARGRGRRSRGPIRASCAKAYVRTARCFWNRVSVGFELWRRLNGVPATMRTPPSTAPARPASPGYAGSGGYGGAGGAGYGGAGGAGYGGDDEGGGYGGGQ